MEPGNKLTLIGKIVVALVVVACFGGAYWLMTKGTGSGSDPADPTAGGSGPSVDIRGKRIEIGLAYGTEKKRWIEAAAQAFAQTPEGKDIKVNLIPMGSIDAGQAIVGGNQKINVWAPASSLGTEGFEQEWRLKNSSDPILARQSLALTPMVFVMWEDRYQGFAKKYGEVTFKTVSQALAEKGGWGAIAGHPEWGFFKFGHTHPNQSNSGLTTLALMAYDHGGKTRGLTVADVVDPGLQTWLRDFERGVSGLSNSTGTLMQDMVLKGPSTYDSVFVYESVAVDYLKNAEGRWGTLRVIYPAENMWNDNPYYILNAPWSNDDQRKAAQVFLDYLMSEPVQAQSLAHGFRPGNPAVPIRTPDSPFTVYERYGLRVDVPSVCEPPAPDVLSTLLTGWQRSQGGR